MALTNDLWSGKGQPLSGVREAWLALFDSHTTFASFQTAIQETLDGLPAIALVWTAESDQAKP